MASNSAKGIRGTGRVLLRRPSAKVGVQTSGSAKSSVQQAILKEAVTTPPAPAARMRKQQVASGLSKRAQVQFTPLMSAKKSASMVSNRVAPAPQTPMAVQSALASPPSTWTGHASPMTPAARTRVSKGIITSTPEKFGSCRAHLKWKAACDPFAGLHRRLYHKTKEALAAPDPVAFLKNKYDDAIPKKPICPYSRFVAERTKLRKLIHNSPGMEEANMRLTSKLADVWKSLPEHEKAPYLQQYVKDKADYEKKINVWQRSEEFREIDLLEKGQKAALRVKKRARKEAEEVEIQQLLEGGTEAEPGRGLTTHRTAVITGMMEPDLNLNGKMVRLGKFIEATGHWVVQPVDGRDVLPLHMAPTNLVWTVLNKEAEKSKQKQKAEAAKKQHKEAEKATRAEQREAEKSMRQAEIQAVKDVHKSLREIAKEQRKQAEMAARVAITETKRARIEAMNEAAKVVEKIFPSKAPRQIGWITAEMAEAECLN